MARLLGVIVSLLAAAPDLVDAQDPAAAPAPQQPEAIPAPPDLRQEGRLATVRLRSGQVLTGRVVSRDDRELVLESPDGVRSVIPAASVAELREAAPGAERTPWEADPNRTRYLYTPSGFMLPQGDGYISQTELVLTTVAYGVTNWLTVGVGGVLPLWFDREGFHLIGLLKVGGEVTPWLHVAGTVQSLWAPFLDENSVGLVFGTVTLGRPDLHVGLSAGAPFIAGQSKNELGTTSFSVSGVWRTSNRIALVTENWFFPGSADDIVVDGVGVRFIGSRLVVDAALVFARHVDEWVGPLPWLDFTWNF